MHFFVAHGAVAKKQQFTTGISFRRAPALVVHLKTTQIGGHVAQAAHQHGGGADVLVYRQFRGAVWQRETQAVDVGACVRVAGVAQGEAGQNDGLCASRCGLRARRHGLPRFARNDG